MTSANFKTAGLAGGAVLCAIGIGAVIIWTFRAPRMVHLAPGVLPQTLPEVNGWYEEPPARQNAATFDLKGIAALQIAGVDKNANLPVLGQLPAPAPNAPLSPAVASAMADFTRRNRPALELFAQGAQYEQARYPIDLSQGSDTRLPHLIGIKRGAQAAEIAAIFDADQGDGKRAAEDVRAALGLARSLKAEPILISQLVRAAGIAIAVDALNQAVNRTTLPPESLGGLAKVLQDLEACDAKGEGFKRAFIVEKVTGLIRIKSLSEPKARNQLIRELNANGSSWGLTGEQKRKLIQYLKQAPNIKLEQDFMEATFQEVLAARAEPFPDRLNDVSVLIPRRVSEADDKGLLLNSWWFDGQDKSVKREARCLANLRLALTALALEQYRAGHNGQYPGALSDLTPDYLPAAPLDPFDGQPLRYRKQAAGYLLYSIGPDQKDDGGAPLTAKGGDMVFAVVAPPAL